MSSDAIRDAEKRVIRAVEDWHENLGQVGFYTPVIIALNALRSLRAAAGGGEEHDGVAQRFREEQGERQRIEVAECAGSNPAPVATPRIRPDDAGEPAHQGIGQVGILYCVGCGGTIGNTAVRGDDGMMRHFLCRRLPARFCQYISLVKGDADEPAEIPLTEARVREIMLGGTFTEVVSELRKQAARISEIEGRLHAVGERVKVVDRDLTRLIARDPAPHELEPGAKSVLAQAKEAIGNWEARVREIAREETDPGFWAQSARLSALERGRVWSDTTFDPPIRVEMKPGETTATGWMWSEGQRTAAWQIYTLVRGDLSRPLVMGDAAAKTLCAAIAKVAPLFLDIGDTSRPACSYCGWVGAVVVDDAAANSAKLAHDKICPSHPMRALERENASLEADLAIQYQRAQEAAAVTDAMLRVLRWNGKNDPLDFHEVCAKAQREVSQLDAGTHVLVEANELEKWKGNTRVAVDYSARYEKERDEARALLTPRAITGEELRTALVEAGFIDFQFLGEDESASLVFNRAAARLSERK